VARPKHHHAALDLRVVPRLHSLLSPLLVHIFDQLRVAVTMLDVHDWHPIHDVEGMPAFELDRGVEAKRVAYNERCLKEVKKKRRPVLGRYAGFWDLFVPIVGGRSIQQMLATGPFGRERPTSSDVLDRWRSLTGRHGHLSDPQFAHYVSMTLSTVVFDEKRLGVFRRLMVCFANLLAGRGDAETLALEATALKTDLLEARFVERMWDLARAMVDPRVEGIWASPYRAPHLAAFGVPRYPSRVIVGLVGGRQDEPDPLDALIRRDEFQRVSVALARARGETVCGRVGDHGVMFLVPAERSESKTRAKLVQLGERAASIARRQFRLELHIGIGPVTGDAPLSGTYQAALAAGERAMSSSLPLAHASSEKPAYALRDLRRQLAELVRERPGNLSARFDRYLEVVSAQSGYRLEVARSQLEAGFERLAEPFLASGALDEKSFDDLCSTLERRAEAADTVSELCSAYRDVVRDMDEALQRPVEAHQERSLRRAVSFIRDHISEPLALSTVARHAGFAPNYFSRLFKRREKVTFERYVRDLRIERAKEMLARTSLSVERVGQLSGFASNHYFHRVFKRVTSETPRECRNRLQRELLADLPPSGRAARHAAR
jgi:AraC-like DNA-binding protein